MPPVDPAPAWRHGAAVLAIAVATVAAYWNTLDNEFLSFDDRKYIYENPLVTGDGGLAAIWGDLWSERPTRHYNPLTYTTFWLEYQLVGLGPPGEAGESIGRPAHPLYHVTQMALHATNAALWILVLRALGVAFLPSVLAAALFALHPINVASVAWMAERKNTLSGGFFLLSLLVYIQHRRRAASAPSAGPWRYLLSLGLFLCGLLSKIAVATLAPLLVVTDRVLDGRWTAAALWRAAPFFALAAILVLETTIPREAAIAKSGEPVDLLLRPFIAVAAIAHYVLTVFLPFDQALIYPRWEESLTEPRYALSLLAVAGSAALIWRHRRRLGEAWLWGLALFLLTISPVLGLKHFIWTQFAFVSDHYMYLGAPGVFLMAAIPLERWRRGGGTHSGRTWVALGAIALALAGCGWRTVQQNRTWHDNVTLWEHTLSVSPDSFLAHLNLGNHHVRAGDDETALRHYREAVRIDPHFIRTRWLCAQCLRRLGREDEAIESYEAAVAAADAKYARSWSVHTEYADYLYELGRLDAALEQYQILFGKKPPNAAHVEGAIRRIESRSDPAAGDAAPQAGPETGTAVEP